MIKDFDKLQTIGYYSGIGSMVSFVIFIPLAFLLAIDEYNPLTMTISKLGVTTSGFIAFIAGTVISGILLIPYMRLFIKTQLNFIPNINVITYLGVIAGLGITGVGVVQDKNNFVFAATHAIVAGIFFTSMGLFIFFLSRQLILLNSQNNSAKLLGYFGFFVIGIAISHFFLSFLKENIEIISIQFNIAAVWQKITVGFYVLWNILLFRYMRNK